MKIFPGISLIMRVFVVFAGFIAICAGTYYSPVPGNNSLYVEGVSRYIWMPDGKGVPHLVDLHEPVDEDFFNSRNGNDNQYWLFTRQNRNSRQILQNGNANSIRNSNYRGNRPTKVIVHGWRNNGNTHMNPMITEAFLAVVDCNVIVVDWNRLASQGYNTAARGVPDIGGRARRVTGLDPAGPTWGRNSQALNRNSGRYVEAIHTDGRILGIMDPIGHADFYPNGGRNPQPGCGASTCSHGRATEFFAATVHRSHLVGRLCPNISEAERSNCNGRQLHMGNANLGKQGTGLFGLRTGANWPF
ncbi:unnamed protein product [Pieris brassicae]|uniref:Lipase domain-containing protein n=1 Tax=Pieris brassicae TaxID=7116 RepID=A0A9P0TEK6_PIEBR|nr:unnamed protein product [Pieris brassicae]